MSDPVNISILIQAYQVGVWAWHHRHVRAGEIEDEPHLPQWSVTHVPTGLRVTGGKVDTALDEWDAERVAQLLDWHVGDPPIESMTAEMVEACVAMALDYEVCAEDGCGQHHGDDAP